MVDSLLSLLLGYGLGSLPLGHLLTRRIRGVDLRVVGSGNIGTANAYRATGARMALAVLLLDIAKGAATVLLAARVTGGGSAPVFAGVAAVVGHAFPIFSSFRGGGKGVATAAGVFGLVMPAATLLAFASFALVVMATRYVSLGSVVAGASLPAFALVTDASVPAVVGGAIAAGLILVRHRANFSRLRDGTERRLGRPGSERT